MIRVMYLLLCILQGLKQAPRRVVQPKTELIDVDLVRGTSFAKAKPQVPWTYITIKTFSRVLLFPFHYDWYVLCIMISCVCVCLIFCFSRRYKAVFCLLKILDRSFGCIAQEAPLQLMYCFVCQSQSVIALHILNHLNSPDMLIILR